MSRLDSFIRRLEAQRACLNWAAGHIDGMAGHVIEIGLGNGRTYDHLQEIVKERQIFVIERAPNPHVACMPDEAHLLVGDLCDVLLEQRRRFERSIALVHSDIGTGDPAHGEKMARLLSCLLPPMLVDAAIVVSDQFLANSALTRLDLPRAIAKDRYFLYEKSDATKN